MKTLLMLHYQHVPLKYILVDLLIDLKPIRYFLMLDIKSLLKYLELYKFKKNTFIVESLEAVNMKFPFGWNLIMFTGPLWAA